MDEVTIPAYPRLSQSCFEQTDPGFLLFCTYNISYVYPLVEKVGLKAELDCYVVNQKEFSKLTRTVKCHITARTTYPPK